MGFIRPKGIIVCQKCGQLHGVDYVCSGREDPQPVRSKFPRLVEPVQIAPEQEILLRMELGGITLIRQVGGVRVILEMQGERSSSRGSGTSQSFIVNHDQFAQILDHGLNGEPADGWGILLALCSLSVLIFSFFVFFA